MSRGLGKLQREILDSLEASKDGTVLPFYTGGANAHTLAHYLYGEIEHPGYVIRWGRRIELPDDVYDLRAVKRIVEIRQQAPANAGSLQSAFSRAIRSLVRRGEVVPVRQASDWEGGGWTTYQEHDARRVHELRFVRKALSAMHICIALRAKPQESPGRRCDRPYCRPSRK